MTRHSLVLLFLIAFACKGSPGQKGQVAQPNPCVAGEAPASITEYLSRRYNGWRVKQPSDLGKVARERWESQSPLSCPGLAPVNLDIPGRPSYAFLLIPLREQRGGHIFLVVSPGSANSEPSATVISESRDDGGADIFIFKESISRLFDSSLRKRYHALGRDGIMLIDAGEHEYEADFYYRTKGGFGTLTVDY